VPRQTPRKGIHLLAAQAISELNAVYRKTVLHNGIRVVTEYIPHVRSVSLGVWIETGSRDESETQNGISHFLEHMVFKGTTKRSAPEISRSLESVGGYLNAFTGKEHTCYYARVLDEYADLSLDVLSDLVRNATFPPKEIEREKSVVIEELRNAEDDPDDIIHDYFEKALYGSHPMGYTIIGTEKNLRSLTRHDIIRYYRSNYHPTKMVVSAAGNIEHEKFVELVSKYFGDSWNGHKPDVMDRQRPRPRKAETLELQKPIQQAHLCMGTRAYSIRSNNRYPLLVLNTLLGDGMSSRLFQNIREKYGFAYSIYSFANFQSDTGTFGVYIGTDKSHVGTSKELIQKELDKLRNKPISKAELQRTKAQLKGNMMLSLENIPSRMMRLGTSELYFKDVSTLDEILRRIDQVTTEDLLETANNLFDHETFSRVVFMPNGAAPNGNPSQS
jgi:predicted Zn-dependent peptidase